MSDLVRSGVPARGRRHLVARRRPDRRRSRRSATPRSWSTQPARPPPPGGPTPPWRRASTCCGPPPGRRAAPGVTRSWCPRAAATRSTRSTSSRTRSGRPRLLFNQTDGTQARIRWSSRPAGGTWSAYGPVSSNAFPVAEPDLAVDPAGTLTAVWWQSNSMHSVITTSTKPVGGAWEAAKDLSDDDVDSSLPQVAVDANGTAVATWRSGSSDPNFSVLASTRSADGTWTAAPAPLSAVGDIAAPDLVVDAAGNATAVWTRRVRRPRRRRVGRPSGRRFLVGGRRAVRPRPHGVRAAAGRRRGRHRDRDLGPALTDDRAVRAPAGRRRVVRRRPAQRPDQGRRTVPAGHRAQRRRGRRVGGPVRRRGGRGRRARRRLTRGLRSERARERRRRPGAGVRLQRHRRVVAARSPSSGPSETGRPPRARTPCTRTPPRAATP